MALGDVLAATGRAGEAATVYARAADLQFDEPIAMRLIDALGRAGKRQDAAAALALYLHENPQSLVGTELDIIAAVVLGGASIFGGRGSVLGTVLGVVLVQLINNNLVLLGVPSTWQRAAVGILLLAGVGVQAVDASRRRKRPAAVLDGAA